MTNREWFLEKLSERTNERLANVFCKVTSCLDCPARVDCWDCSGIKEIAKWLAQEREEGGTE